MDIRGFRGGMSMKYNKRYAYLQTMNMSTYLQALRIFVLGAVMT